MSYILFVSISHLSYVGNEVILCIHTHVSCSTWNMNPIGECIIP